MQLFCYVVIYVYREYWPVAMHLAKMGGGGMQSICLCGKMEWEAYYLPMWHNVGWKLTHGMRIETSFQVEKKENQLHRDKIWW